MISKIINHYTVLFWGITLVVVVYQFFVLNVPFLKALFSSYVLLIVGLRSLIAFLANWIPPYCYEIAKIYGWPLEGSIQKEIAATDGTFGILGIASSWLDNEGFLLATILGYTFCCFFAELGSWVTIYFQKQSPHYKKNKMLERGMSLDLLASTIILSLIIVNNL